VLLYPIELTRLDTNYHTTPLSAYATREKEGLRMLRQVEQDKEEEKKRQRWRGRRGRDQRNLSPQQG
jgi:hypothetical protein